jgi:hypothetical protein
MLQETLVGWGGVTTVQNVQRSALSSSGVRISIASRRRCSPESSEAPLGVHLRTHLATLQIAFPRKRFFSAWRTDSDRRGNWLILARRHTEKLEPTPMTTVDQWSAERPAFLFMLSFSIPCGLFGSLDVCVPGEEIPFLRSSSLNDGPSRPDL